MSIITLGAGGGAGYLSTSISEQPTILPRVQIANVDLGGKTVEEATQLIQTKVDEFSSQPFIFSSKAANKGEIEETSFEVTAEDLGLVFDVRTSVEQAFAIGHSASWTENLQAQVSTAFLGDELPMQATFNNDVREAYFETGFLSIEKPARDARLAYEKGQLKILDARSGKEIVRAPVFEALDEQARALEHSTITLTLGETNPDVTVDDLDATQALAEKILSSKLNLYYKDKNYSPSPEVLGSWLEFHSVVPNDVLGKAACACGLPESTINPVRTETGDTGTPTTQKDEQKVPALVVTPFEQERRGEKTTEPYYVMLPPENFLDRSLSAHMAVVGINRNELNHWLLENVAADIDVPGQNARLAFTKGKVTVTQPSKSGTGVDVEKAARDIIFSIASDKPQVKLALKEKKPEISEDRIAELGINTLIGKGVSEYTFSPPNRIENIHVGLSKLHGLVIAPGEEFSTVGSLAPIDAAAGYLPELVITGNKITPQYGGGLCQVSSTLFRAALDTGLDITSRTNHAFSVSHYVWPYDEYGVEATIYDPEPDLKFINDTDAYILIQAYTTEDEKAVVEFYGTDPGRTTQIDGPYRLSGSPAGGGTTTFTYTVFENKTGKVFRKEEFISIFQPLSKFKLTN